MVDEKNKTCEGFEEDLVALVDGELPDERAMELTAHLKDCPRCRALKDELTELGQALGGWQAGDPRPEWEAAAERRIRDQAERQAEEHAADQQGGGLFGRLRWSNTLAVGAACAMVLVVGLALFSGGAKLLSSPSANALAGNEDASAQTADDPTQLYAHKSMRDFGPSAGASGSDYSPPAPGHWSQPPARPNHWSQPAARPASDEPWDRQYNSPRTRPLFKKRTEPIEVVRLPNSDDPAQADPVQPFSANSGQRPAFEPAPAAPPAGPVAVKDGWYESNYRAGAGERERIEKLIQAGVLVDGQKLKLGTFARNYHQAFSVPARRALGLHADLDHAKVLTSGGEVFLQIGVQAARREMSRRPPVNIALVIDRSGSMAEGDKMGSARAAATRFVDGLRADDRVAIIAYDDQVEMAGAGDTPRDKRSLKTFIASLSPRGSTNIHDALDAAYRQVADRARPGLVNTVMLLSDGLPTAGNTDTDAIVALSAAAAEHGISTTTIGVGLDYNDALMMGVARRGQGHYHFVKDATSIEPIFDKEFQALNRVVARALRLRIKVADDVVLRRVLGSHSLSGAETASVRREERHIDQRLYQELGIRPDRERDDEDGIRMMIPYFFSGDSHVVMLQLWVPPGTDTRRLAEVTLKYKDLLYNKNGMDEREAVVHYTRDNDAVVASISRPVKKNLLGYRAGEALLSASELVGRGQAARAGEMVAEQAVLFREAGAAWGDKQLAKDAELLGRYRDVIWSLDDPALAGRDSLRSYLAKTMSHSGYRLVQ